MIEGQATRVNGSAPGAEHHPDQPSGGTDAGRAAATSASEAPPATSTKGQGQTWTSAPTPSSAPAQTGQPTLEQILDAATEFGITRERYEAYADKLWGRGWKLNPAGRRKALAEIARFKDDPDGFVNKIEAEIKVFA